MDWAMTSSPTRSTRLSSFRVSSFTNPVALSALAEDSLRTLTGAVALTRGGSPGAGRTSDVVNSGSFGVGGALAAVLRDGRRARDHRAAWRAPVGGAAGLGRRWDRPGFAPWSWAPISRVKCFSVSPPARMRSMTSEVILSSERRAASRSDSKSCARSRSASR